MSSSNFSPSTAIRTGWNITTKNFWYVMQLVLLILVFPQILTMFFRESNLISLAVSFYSFFVTLGGIKLMLSLLKNKKLPIMDLFSEMGSLVNAFIAAVIAGFAVFVGMIFLIIPGIYVALRIQFAIYLVVDKKMKGIEAIKTSWKMTEGNVMNLFVLAILSIFAMILGVLALGVGVLVAYPVVALAQAYAYRQIQSK